MLAGVRSARFSLRDKTVAGLGVIAEGELRG